MNWESATGCEGRRKHRVNMESTSVYAGGGGCIVEWKCKERLFMPGRCMRSVDSERTSIYAAEAHA